MNAVPLAQLRIVGYLDGLAGPVAALAWLQSESHLRLEVVAIRLRQGVQRRIVNHGCHGWERMTETIRNKIRVIRVAESARHAKQIRGFLPSRHRLKGELSEEDAL